MFKSVFIIILITISFWEIPADPIDAPQPDAPVTFLVKDDEKISSISSEDADVPDASEPIPDSGGPSLEPDRESRQFGFGGSFGIGNGGYGGGYGLYQGHYAPDYGHQHHHHHQGEFGGNYGHGHDGYHGHGGYGHYGGDFGHGGYGGGHGHGGYYEHGHGGYGHGGGHGHGGYDGHYNHGHDHHHHHHGYGRGFIQENTQIYPPFYYPSKQLYGFEPQPPLPLYGVSQTQNILPSSPVLIGPPEPIPPLAPQQDIAQQNIIVPPTLPQEIKPIAPEVPKLDVVMNKGGVKANEIDDDQECICRKKSKVDSISPAQEEFIKENTLRRN